MIYNLFQSEIFHCSYDLLQESTDVSKLDKEKQVQKLENSDDERLTRRRPPATPPVKEDAKQDGVQIRMGKDSFFRLMDWCRFTVVTFGVVFCLCFIAYVFSYYFRFFI